MIHQRRKEKTEVGQQTQFYARKRINAYTASLAIGLASFFFLIIVPFLPGSPILPLLVAAGLAVSSFRRPRWASAILNTLVFFSILWQMLGFGLTEFFSTSVGTIVALILIISLVANIMSARLEPTSTALAVFAVALMFTPQYYLSVAVIAAAAIIYDISSIGPLSSTFIAAISPMLLLENAIYYGSLPKGAQATPIIFSQLTYLGSNLRPPLPGLNIFLTGFPPNFVSSYSTAVVRFISNSVSVMIVPLFLLGIVFSSSVSIAGIVNSMLNRFYLFQRAGHVLKVISPTLVSIMTSVAFATLIMALSSRGIGGYETSLNSNPFHAVYMVLSSSLLGALFTVREFIIEGLESVEAARARLLQLLVTAKGGIQRSHEVIDKMLRAAPTVELTEEIKALDEDSSYVKDIERGLGTASLDSLARWIADLEQRLIPFLESIPEKLRLKTVKELNTLSSLVSTFNATIHEAGVQLGFPDLGTINTEMTIDDALQTYAKAVPAIKEAAIKLYDMYVSAINSFNILSDREAIAPPVNPAHLFDSYDYVTGMKLLAEEYWLSFHVSYGQELDSKVTSLSNILAPLEEISDTETRTGIEQIIESIGKAKPADSTYVLQKIVELLSLLDSIVNRAFVEAEQLEKTAAPFATIADIVHFEAIGQSSRLDNLRNTLKATKPSFGNVTSFIQTATSVLGDVAERKNKDEQNLILLCQYFVARKVIESFLQNRNVIRITELPFQHDAAIIFARLYSLRNMNIEYDDANETLMARHA